MEDNYILWYISDDSEQNGKTLPCISIIDANNPDNNFSKWGYQDVESLENMLNTHTVSNDVIVSDKNIIIQGHVLLITNEFTDEKIQIYTLTGQLVTSVFKNDNMVQIDASRFPKGVLLVYSSTGWSTKIIIQ